MAAARFRVIFLEDRFPFESLPRSFDSLLSAFRFPRYLVLFSHGTVLVARISGPNERGGRCRNRGTVP